MKNKLSLNDDIKAFLDTDNKQIWDLIIENNITELLSLPTKEDNTVQTIVSELFSSNDSKTLDEYDLITIREHNGSFIRNLVRLIYALEINENNDAILKKVVDRLFDSFPEIVERIQKETFGYPARMVTETILSEAATTRAALMNLIYYFRAKDDLDSLHFVVVMRTTITLAIMGNYKNVVGHDMVETAKIKEQVGETEAALTFYNGARNNLKNELHWFVESPEMGPSEDDVVMLQALKNAFEALDRLNNTTEYTKECNLIDEILSREYVEYNFDEEDEDEE